MLLTSILEFCTVIDNGVHVVSFIRQLPTFHSCLSNRHQAFKAKLLQVLADCGCFEVISYFTSTFDCLLCGRAVPRSLCPVFCLIQFSCVLMILTRGRNGLIRTIGVGTLEPCLSVHRMIFSILNLFRYLLLVIAHLVVCRCGPICI